MIRTTLGLRITDNWSFCLEVIIYMDSNKKVTPKVIWSIVGTAGLACSGVLVETSMNITFPIFKQPLNNIQWITTAYLLAVTLTIVLAAYSLSRSA